MRIGYFTFFVLMISVMSHVPITAAQHGQRMMRPRVPADKLEEARALTSPLPYTEDSVAQGKAIYEGKGTCVNCHGVRGHGDGPGGTNLHPPPRVFRSRGFWRHRTEGEIFWVIKHGSPGTAMIPFGGLLSDEEIWAVMLYERSLAGTHGRGGEEERHQGMGRGRRYGGGGKHGMNKKMDGHHLRGESDECCHDSDSP